MKKYVWWALGGGLIYTLSVFVLVQVTHIPGRFSFLDQILSILTKIGHGLAPILLLPCIAFIVSGSESLKTFCALGVGAIFFSYFLIGSLAGLLLRMLILFVRR